LNPCYRRESIGTNRSNINEHGKCSASVRDNAHGQNRSASTPNPAGDARPNSDRVPEVYALDASVRRIVVLRFKFGTDLLAGLQRMVKEEKIRNAVILSGFGSVRDYQVHQVGNRDLPPKDVL
jgi:hypothetical protein